MDDPFLGGLLHPVRHPHAAALSAEWVKVGIQLEPAKTREDRFDGLLRALADAIPASTARHEEWLHFAQRWAQLAALWAEMDSLLPESSQVAAGELRSQVDKAFLDWILARYTGLHNQPSSPPVMVHHIPRHLGRQMFEAGVEKVALLVVDGLALDQWVTLRDELSRQRSDLRFREGAAFAWIPTLTSVSRQALFAGKPPLFFPSSIGTTDKEGLLWTQFWVDRGLAPLQVGCAKGLGDGGLHGVEEITSRPKLRAVGLVVDKVDRIMHGMDLGSAGMHNQVRQWAAQGYLARLVDLLLDRGFGVYLTSDHGNLEARGCGRPAEGSVADLRGERVRVYPDAVLRHRVASRYPRSIEWPATGLPDGYLPLLAPGRTAFVAEDRVTVAHGGISIDEVVVPLVQVERKKT